MRAVGELGRVHRSPRPVCSPSRHRATARCHRDAGPGPAAADDKASSPASEDDAALSADAGRHPLARRGAMLALVAASTAASAAVAPLAALAAAESNTAQPTITQRVFFDLAACEPGLGSSSRATACAATVPLGRIVVGLYGDAAPSSVALFVQLATAVGTPLSYRGSYVDRILPGQYLSAGAGLLPFTVVNDDAVRSSSFEQRHVAPGTVSLVLSDPEEPRRPVAGRFRVTTGPGPQPQLDSLGIVVGRVVEGLAVVERVARLPTFTPAGSVARQYNSLAGALGDKRAAIARVAWSRPREAVVVTDCGLL